PETAPPPTPPPPPPPPAPSTTEAPARVAAASAPVPRRGAAVYRGLGAWIDAYDWSLSFGKDGPLVEVGDVDRMAELGVQTLYVQATRWNSPTDVLEPERLVPLIDRARRHGIKVVAWYLPTLEDPAADLRRMLAVAELDVDSLAVDIEARNVGDVAERNRRLVDLSHRVRHALPDVALGGIVFPPVVSEVVNPGFWPGFPWAELAPYYDVWLPMSYQSNRPAASGYRDAYRYAAENIDRVRANLGRPDAPVHLIGGIADLTSGADVEALIRAARERGAVGGSLYDWRTTDPGLWPHLQPFRA
ncbi:MAG: hypothetical protein ACRDZ9_02240, partial [Acidimicrobiales bacterium]